MTTRRKTLAIIRAPDVMEPIWIFLTGWGEWLDFCQTRCGVHLPLDKTPELISELQRIYVEQSKLPTDPLLRFFEYQLLPRHLQEVSKPFRYVAHRIVADLPQTPERTVALRKLLEARRCAVRACLQTTFDNKGE